MDAERDFGANKMLQHQKELLKVTMYTWFKYICINILYIFFVLYKYIFNDVKRNQRFIQAKGQL